MVHILLKPGLEYFEHYFVNVWDECNCAIVWALFGIALLWDCNETDFVQSCGHCCVFQICWQIESSTFIASSFRIWNSSAGILSSPLALFIVILPKAYLTLHSRLSGSRWVTTSLSLFRSFRPFLYSSVYFCHLFLIFSASFMSLLFLSFIEPIFAWNILLVSLIFLKRSLDFPILLFSSISLHWWMRKAFLSLLAILWNFAFKWVYLSFSPLPFPSLLFTAIWQAFSDNHFAFFNVFFFLHFLFLEHSLLVHRNNWCLFIDSVLAVSVEL